MKRTVIVLLPALLAVAAVGTTATADVQIDRVITPPNTVGGGNLSAFAINPDTDEYASTGYNSGFDVRFGQIVDDTVLPWDVSASSALNNFQLAMYQRAGRFSRTSSFNFWGANFSHVDGAYFLNSLATLKESGSSVRIDQERSINKFFPWYPDSPVTLPTNVSVSNAGGVYKLIDDNLDSSDGFLTSGVQAGQTVTVFAVDWMADVWAREYEIVQVLSDTELQLDMDPCGSGSYITGAGYVLSLQPHVTLGDFRAVIPHFANNPKSGARAHMKGAVSADGSTLYIAEGTSDNIIAVDTQVPGQVDIFVSSNAFVEYVQAQVDAGRRKAIINPYWIYRDGESSDYLDWTLTNSTATYVKSSEAITAAVGGASLEVVFDSAGAELLMEYYRATGEVKAPAPSDFVNLDFWIHGGDNGGQEIDLWLINSNGVGSSIALDPPQAGTWTNVVIPLTEFSVPHDIFYVTFASAAAGTQETFYLDQITFNWSDPIPAWAGQYDPQDSGPSTADMFLDEQGRLWFTEAETGDIVWTDDGLTINTFLESEFIATTLGVGSTSARFSNGSVVIGLMLDRMGTLYWSENFFDTFWRVNLADPTQIVQLASDEDIEAAIGVSTARGLKGLTQRGTDLLTFNFVECNCIYKIHMNTFDFGDFDEDLDVDADDFQMFFTDCMAGPDVTTPPDICTNGVEDAFEWSDLDDDGDVDMEDYGKFQRFLTGPLAPI